MKNKWHLFIFLITLSLCAKAQEEYIYVKKNQVLVLRDTMIIPENDTLLPVDLHVNFKIRNNPYNDASLLYHRIKDKSSNKKIMRSLTKILLNDPDKKSEIIADQGGTSNQLFREIEGKIIRNIKFKYVDIFEGSVHDTLKSASSKFGLIANKYHTNTQKWVIKSNLTIRSGTEANPYELADNERLLRRLNFIEDARIYYDLIANTEYVDIIIVLKDRFHWGLQGDGRGPSQYELNLMNRSVGGLGRYASVSYFYNSKTDQPHGYAFNVGGQNSFSSITNWQFYNSNYWDKKDIGINIQKEFLTPSIKYGGGIELATISDSTIVLDGDTEDGHYYRLNFQDFWIGRAWTIPSASNRRNIILSARVLDRKFDERPAVEINNNEIYYNRTLLLGQITYSVQRFIKSNYVLRFGVSEDIPVGFRVSAVYGKDFNEFFTQDYIGVQHFWAKYYKKLGYFMLDQKVGTFINKNLSNGVFRSTIIYYTPLWTLGRFKHRTFLTLGHVDGLNQASNHQLTLKNKIRDISGDEIEGEKTKYIKAESIIYTPWYFYGFRFFPFTYGSLSRISDKRTGFNNTDYSTAGLGIRIKNESLVIDTFELRVTHFINPPVGRSNYFFGLSITTPIDLNNAFKYKPKLIPFE